MLMQARSALCSGCTQVDQHRYVPYQAAPHSRSAELYIAGLTGLTLAEK
jgi:hypothetical protein